MALCMSRPYRSLSTILRWNFPPPNGSPQISISPGTFCDVLQRYRNDSTCSSLIRNQRVPFPAVAALGLCRVAVDEKTVKHRVVHTANFVFNEKDTATIIGIDNFFKAILMVTDIFRNQATTLQVSVGPGEIGDIDSNMVP